MGQCNTCLQFICWDLKPHGFFVVQTQSDLVEVRPGVSGQIFLLAGIATISRWCLRWSLALHDREKENGA